MDMALERIREKITELETKLANLRITEHELQELDMPRARNPKVILEALVKPEEAANDVPVPQRQTLVSAITAVLGQHGALSAAGIAGYIVATGREIDNRAVSFSLQALKKRGLVKNANGEWTLIKGRSKRSRS